MAVPVMQITSQPLPRCLECAHVTTKMQTIPDINLWGHMCYPTAALKQPFYYINAALYGGQHIQCNLLGTFSLRMTLYPQSYIGPVVQHTE